MRSDTSGLARNRWTAGRKVGSYGVPAVRRACTEPRSATRCDWGWDSSADARLAAIDSSRVTPLLRWSAPTSIATTEMLEPCARSDRTCRRSVSIASLERPSCTLRDQNGLVCKDSVNRASEPPEMNASIGCCSLLGSSSAKTTGFPASANMQTRPPANRGLSTVPWVSPRATTRARRTSGGIRSAGRQWAASAGGKATVTIRRSFRRLLRTCSMTAKVGVARHASSAAKRQPLAGCP